MTVRRVGLRAVLVALLALTGAACGSGEDSTTSTTAAERDTGDLASESVLVIDGKHIGADGLPFRDGARLDETREPARRRSARATGPQRERWPAPPLFTDGTIDDGPDPFEGERVQLQPIPIEDDPATTAAVDAAAEQVRRIDRDVYARWMTANAQRSPWHQVIGDPVVDSLVDVTVERCGGARTVATGVVLADETVVTTVHAIESASKRVRVAPSAGNGPRIPAMIRYLDVDDDVAVLKVPGLRVRPMGTYVPTGTTPRLGFAYGVANGGNAGTVRRTPVLVSMQETSIRLEQPDGFARQITDRSVQTLIGGITTGFSGGIVTASNDEQLREGFGFHGLVRARVPFRSDTAGIVVPSRIVRQAITASQRLDQWFEHRPGGCPQWRR